MSPRKGVAGICVEHFFNMDKTVSIMFIKSVNSTKLDDIANSLNTGASTESNKMKLNMNNRTAIFRLKITVIEVELLASSSDDDLSISVQHMFKDRHYHILGEKTRLRFKQTLSQFLISSPNCCDPSLFLHNIKMGITDPRWERI